MGKNLTNFERSLREAYEKYEAPYDSKSWKAIEAGLVVTTAKHAGNAASTVAAIAATIFLVATSVVSYFTIFDGSIKTPKARIAESGSYMSSEDLMRSVIIRSKDRSENASDAGAVSDSSQPSSDRQSVALLPIDSRELEIDEAETDHTAELNIAQENEPQGTEATAEVARDTTQKEKKADELSFAVDLKEACAGVSVTFELTTGAIQGSYLWNFGDGNFSSQPNPTHVFSKPGTYDITLSVTSHEDGVIRSKSIKNMIVINPVPEAQFDWDFINDSAMAPRVKFRNYSERAKQAEWTLVNSGSNEINPELTLSKAGEYPIKLVVSNEFGCLDSIYQYISIEEDYTLLAPDAFSPNNDGINDTFMPEALKLRNVQFKLTIYNNNQPIFETEDKYEPWKGVLPNGTLARPGKTFPWVVNMTNEDGVEEMYSGTITIIP